MKSEFFQIPTWIGQSEYSRGPRPKLRSAKSTNLCPSTHCPSSARSIGGVRKVQEPFSLGTLFIVRPRPGQHSCTPAPARTMGNISIGHPDFSLCFKLEEIRDHFYYTNGGYFSIKSGLGFALSPSITKFLY